MIYDSCARGDLFFLTRSGPAFYKFDETIFKKLNVFHCLKIYLFGYLVYSHRSLNLEPLYQITIDLCSFFKLVHK